VSTSVSEVIVMVHTLTGGYDIEDPSQIEAPVCVTRGESKNGIEPKLRGSPFGLRTTSHANLGSSPMHYPNGAA